jgi:cell division protein FtsW
MLKQKTSATKWFSIGGDSALLMTILVLLGIGLIMIFSAGVSYGNLRFGDEYYFFKRQLIGLTTGLFFLFLFSKIRYQFWRKLVVPLFFLSLFLLVLVLIPGIGTAAYGAARWIQVGPISFQPSELMKFSLILYLAAWLSGKNVARKTDFYEGLLPFVILLLVVSFLIMKQPDTGTLGILSIIALSIFFAAGARFAHIASLIGGGIVLLAFLIQIAPYRIQRMMVFLNPEHDPSGAGYQIQQALIALGSGGWFGIGLGQSRQKFSYLPEPVTDSIFAIIGEELGFLGCAIIVSLFVFFAWRGFRIARHAPDEFGTYVAVGIVTWVSFQAFMNIFAITGLIPLTGITLPLISYGGTSLAVILGSLGILLNISKQAKSG